MLQLKWCLITKYITKIHGTTKYDAEDLDLVMLMYSLIECISNCSGTTVSWLFYSKNEATNCNFDIANTDNFKTFRY